MPFDQLHFETFTKGLNGFREDAELSREMRSSTTNAIEALECVTLGFSQTLIGLPQKSLKGKDSGMKSNSPVNSSPVSSRTDFVSTAIVYPNTRIHVGWAWECLGADWLVRGLRLQGRQTFFSTGMDEHSINVQRSAEAKSLTPQAYCDQMAKDIEKVLQQMGMSYDRFIRTSDPDHHRVVEALVQKAYEKGDIYQAKYEGHYCESCEAYYTEKDLKDGLCPSHGKAPKWVSEENYFFRLSKYQDKLLRLIEEHPQFIQPDYRRAEIRQFYSVRIKGLFSLPLDLYLGNPPSI